MDFNGVGCKRCIDIVLSFILKWFLKKLFIVKLWYGIKGDF